MPDTTTPHLEASTHLGAVRLAVRDIDSARDFYTGAIGLRPLPDAGDGVVRLGAGGRSLVELESAPDARPAARGSSGLFHLALLVPDRAALADAVLRVSGAGWQFSGAADHLVSEALYLNDPEHNGIEIYRDRPREEWAYHDGALQMDTLALDLDAVLAERTSDTPPATMHDDTALGHVHLRVDSLETARRFHVGIAGFDVMVENYPGALFVAAGGYHHHLGMNIWGSNRPAEPGTLGLRHYEVVVPDAAALASVSARAVDAGVGEVEADGTLSAHDPAGNVMRVRTA